MMAKGVSIKDLIFRLLSVVRKISGVMKIKGGRGLQDGGLCSQVENES